MLLLKKLQQNNNTTHRIFVAQTLATESALFLLRLQSHAAFPHYNSNSIQQTAYPVLKASTVYVLSCGYVLVSDLWF